MCCQSEHQSMLLNLRVCLLAHIPDFSIVITWNLDSSSPLLSLPPFFLPPPPNIVKTPELNLVGAIYALGFLLGTTWSFSIYLCLDVFVEWGRIKSQTYINWTYMFQQNTMCYFISNKAGRAPHIPCDLNPQNGASFGLPLKLSTAFINRNL